MPVFNYPKKEVNVKVVYYGPGLSGKTTNLQKIHDGIKPDFRGKLVSLATQTDRTLFFDFMPMELGSLGGYKVRLHLYTVPGQVHYNATRKLVLKGVDGVVFVADSQRAMSDANIESVLNLEKNLQSYGKTLDDIPHIIQANKRDLDDILSMEEVNSLLNHHGAVLVEAAASEGNGVMETLTGIVRLVMRGLKDQFDTGLQDVPPPARVRDKNVAENDEPVPDPEPVPPVEAEQEEDVTLEEPSPEAGDQAVDDEPEESLPEEDLEREIALNPNLEEVDLPEPAPEPAIKPVTEPSAQVDVSNSSNSLADDSQVEEMPGIPVKLLVPVEGVGTLELAVNVSARVLKDGEIKAVEVGAAVVVPAGDIGMADPEEALPDVSEALEAADEQHAAVSEDTGTFPPGEPVDVNAAVTDGQQETPEAALLAEPEPLPELPPADTDLPPLGDDSGQPLGAPLDGQEPDSFDIPDLPQEEEKIVLDDNTVEVKDETPSPDVPSDYDPTVLPIDFDFPETAPEEEPRKKGLFGRFGKKK